jgi:hypothetical protein
MRARGASEGDHAMRLEEVLESSGLPILVVTDSIQAPPKSLVIVTERRDLERSVLAHALGVVKDLRSRGGPACVSDRLEIDIVHVIRLEYEWTDARVALAEQLESSLGAADFLVRSVRPALLGQLGPAIDEREPDLVAVLADMHGAAEVLRLGRLARSLSESNPKPLLVLPTGR